MTCACQENCCDNADTYFPSHNDNCSSECNDEYCHEYFREECINCHNYCYCAL